MGWSHATSRIRRRLLRSPRNRCKCLLECVAKRAWAAPSMAQNFAHELKRWHYRNPVTLS
jgi:hypothetical protein